MTKNKCIPSPVFSTFVFSVMVLSSVQAMAQSVDLGGDSLVSLWNNTTPTWSQTIDAFQSLSDEYAEASLFEVGQSDVGRPIHAFVVSKEAKAIESLASLKS